jgi:hypothetical protein
MGPGGGVPLGRENRHDPDSVLVVEARLLLIRHPAQVVGATATPAFMEHRLVEAEGGVSP